MERTATRRRVGPLLLKVCWADEQRTFEFEHDESTVVVVGSGRDADVRLDSDSVAPVQLHFERIDGRIWIVPDRRGEVRMNRRWVTTPEVVGSGAVIKLAGSWIDLTVHPLESAVPLSVDDDDVTLVRRPPDISGVCRTVAEKPAPPMPPARHGVTTSMTVAVGARRTRPESPAPPLAMHVDPEPTPLGALPALDVDDAPPQTVSEPGAARGRLAAKQTEPTRTERFSVATPRKRHWSNLFALGSAIGHFALRRPLATLALTLSYGLLMGAALAHAPRVLAPYGYSSVASPCAALSAAAPR